MSLNAERLVEVVQARGSDAQDPRDAAHEACHALDARLGRKPWTRALIHEGLLRAQKSSLIMSLVDLELRARAVERLVCEMLSTPYDSAMWLDVMMLEVLKTTGAVFPSRDWVARAVERRCGWPEMQRRATSILKLRLPVSGHEKTLHALRQGESHEDRRGRRSPHGR